MDITPIDRRADDIVVVPKYLIKIYLSQNPEDNQCLRDIA